VFDEDRVIGEASLAERLGLEVWRSVMAAVNPIPEGFPRVTPYLICDGAAKAIEFYTSVLGATERMRMPAPDGRIGHAEIQIGDSVIMLADEYPEMGARSPRSLGGTPISLMVYVEDVDKVVARAVEAGAKELRPVENRFYVDRSGEIEDPFGHRWSVASHVEDVSEEEMGRRMKEASASM
jgi:PhnB protein